MPLVLLRPATRVLPPLSTLTLALAASLPVHAAEPLVSEYVEVFGQAVSLDKALRQQRASDRIESVVRADDIGQLPDENAAEALQRVPGVSVERDQGEGRFVTVRGLAPDLNSATINGTQVPAPESGRRAVALDVLPAELVQSLSVVKTLTPDMDANSLGGTVEVQTLSAFDHDGPYYTGTVEGSYDGNTGQTSPKLSGAVSQRFAVGERPDTLGIAAAFSWQKRDFGSDNVETGGNWDFSGSTPLLEETEQRDYRITRERTGVGLNFDLRPDAGSQYYLRTLYSRFTDTEIRQAAGAEFADPIAPGTLTDAEGYRELKDRQETQEISSIVLGGEKRLGLWTLAGQAGYSRASEDTPLHVAGAVFEGIDDFSNVTYTNTQTPVLVAGADYYDPASYALSEIEQARQSTSDTLRQMRLDLSRDYVWGTAAAQMKFGAKLSRREKNNDTDVWVYEDFGAANTSLSAYTAGTVDYTLGAFGPAINAASVATLLASLDPASAFDEEESRINDYTMTEDINAAYIMNSVDFDTLRLIAGLRYETTDFTANGTGVRDGSFEAITVNRTDSHWLPGLHVLWRAAPETQVRAAYTRSVVRPTFEQLAPGFIIDGDEAEFGNPNLAPLTSHNLDLGIARYLGRAGILSAGLFYKDIKNFVYATDVAGTGAFASFDEAKTFANGDEADIWGLELSFSRQLDWLPAPWNGLLIGANATFSRASATITGYSVNAGQTLSRKIDLPGHSDTVGNLLLGWENPRLSARIAVNFKSDYLNEVAAIDDPAHDLSVNAQTFLDFSLRYFLSKHVQLIFSAQNLTDENYYVYTGSSNYNAQYEEYGRTYKLGLSFGSF
jgi:TonB-dependent receptor